MHWGARANSWPLALALVAAAVSVVPSPYATLWPDTVRDVSQSLAMARGETLPLAGPSINLGPHLGPASIWLQAIALAIAPSFVATTVFAALIAALKFPLLHGVGVAISGPRMGLCLVAAAAFPSIAVYQWMVLLHPNWVEAGIAGALLLAALAWKRKSIGMAHASAASLGLAIQMHPTAIFYAPFVAFAFVATGARGLRLAAHAAGATLLVLAWFAPVLLAGLPGQREGAEGVAARTGAALAAFSPSDALVVLRTAYVDVPVAIGATYAGALGVPEAAWNTLLAFVAAAAIAGIGALLADGGKGRRIAASLCALLVAGWVGATAIRSFTSFYLCYFLLPLSALVFGAGFDRLAGSQRAWLRAWGWAAIAGAMLCLVVAAVGARAVGRGGEMVSRIPVLGDLRHPAPAIRAGVRIGSGTGFRRAPSLPLGWRHRAARRACVCVRRGREPRPAAALPHACGRDSDPWAQAGRHSPGDDRARRGEGAVAFPRRAFQGTCRVPRAGPASGAGAPGRAGLVLLRIAARSKAAGTVELEFATGPGSHVVVYRMKPFASTWQALAATRDGLARRAGAVYVQHGRVRVRGRVGLTMAHPVRDRRPAVGGRLCLLT
jgi:hypothetical protein